MKPHPLPAPRSKRRRQLLLGAAALAAVPLARGQAAPLGLPEIPELAVMLGGRTPRNERLVLDMPRIAENGGAVPARIALPAGSATSPVRTVALFSEINPVRTMMVLDYPVPVRRFELETRVRLNGTQRIVAVALLADDTVYTAVAECIVAASACMDGT